MFSLHHEHRSNHREMKMYFHISRSSEAENVCVCDDASVMRTYPAGVTGCLGAGNLGGSSDLRLLCLMFSVFLSVSTLFVGSTGDFIAGCFGLGMGHTRTHTGLKICKYGVMKDVFFLLR